MVIIRPTLDLAKKIGIKNLSAKNDLKSTTCLGDWYANSFVVSRKHYIIFISEKTRLPVVIYAAPFKTFFPRFQCELATLLSAIGLPKDGITKELSHMKADVLAKTSNRSVVGSLNDYIRLLLDCEKYGSKNFRNNLERSLFLSEVPSLVMDAVFPREAAERAFSRARLSLVGHK